VNGRAEPPRAEPPLAGLRGRARRALMSHVILSLWSTSRVARATRVVLRLLRRLAQPVRHARDDDDARPGVSLVPPVSTLRVRPQLRHRRRGLARGEGRERSLRARHLRGRRRRVHRVELRRRARNRGEIRRRRSAGRRRRVGTRGGRRALAHAAGGEPAPPRPPRRGKRGVKKAPAPSHSDEASSRKRQTTTRREAGPTLRNHPPVT
jgi:hypothetical protein